MRVRFTLGLSLAGLFVASIASADEAARCRETGEHAVCVAAATPLEAQSPETALELYAAACAKRPEQCWALVAYGQRVLKKKDAARAAAILDKGCELKSAAACAFFAGELEEGERGIPQDLPKAARLFDRACELGSARACVIGAAMVDDGRGAPRSAARSAKMRARADAIEKAVVRPAPNLTEAAANEAICRKQQDATKCLAAGVVFQETDAVKAEELFRVGCTADKASCGLWGFAIDRVRRDDPSRGQRVLEQGCLENAAVACLVLAELTHVGYRSLQRNEPRAAELYEKACYAGSPDGCRVTASRFRGAKNAAKADELRDRAAKMEEERDRALLEAHERLVKDAATIRAREAYVRELERRRGEWRALADQTRARWDERMARLAIAETGQTPTPRTPLPPQEAQQSPSREGAIKRMAKALFP
ncbi:MAG: sel1 repeat family protein [Labilithrix sp.]|nr:sel1 repeat family protein [Labilithrix sp.]